MWHKLAALVVGLAFLPHAMAARYLALGDSYTIGEGVVEAGRWPNQLKTMLDAKKPSISFIFDV